MTVTWRHVGRTVTWRGRSGRQHRGRLHNVREPGTRGWWRRAGKVDVWTPDGWYLLWAAELDVVDEETVPCG